MGKNKKKHNNNYAQNFDDDYDEKTYSRKRQKAQKEKIDVGFEFDEAFFEKEYHRRKREINERKKREKRAKENRWN